MIKRGDVLPAWGVTWLDGDQPVNGPATAIKVLAWRNNPLVIDRAIAEPYSAVGEVVMAWRSADTNVVGDLLFEVEVMWPGSKPQTFPPDGWLTTRVCTDLG